MRINYNVCIRKCNKVVGLWRKKVGQFSLFRTNEAGDGPILFNEIAATICECVSDCQNRNDLLNKIAQMYGIKQHSTEMFAIDSFITQMERINLLQEEAEGM